MEMRICQSCAMPMNEDNLLGSNADGSKNQDYCVHCYQNGQFMHPNETMEQMIETCVPFMVKEGWDEDKARTEMQNLLPKLKRWQ